MHLELQVARVQGTRFRSRLAGCAQAEQLSSCALPYLLRMGGLITYWAATCT